MGSYEVTINVEFLFDVITTTDEEAVQDAMQDLERYLAAWNIPQHNIISAEVTDRPILGIPI